MKFRLILITFLLTNAVISQNEIPLKPCPKSPNCVCTIGPKARKNKKPFTFTGSLLEAKEKIKAILKTFENNTLSEEKDNYLHYEFTTKIGNYLDDVEFYFNKDTKQIHFRSASREGYGDFGANKRRMKKIRKRWLDD